MHRILLSVLTASCILLAAALSPAQAQYTLEYKFEKGKTYRFGDSTTVNSSQEMMGQEMKTTSTVISKTKLLATDVTASKSAVIEVSPEAMSIAMKTPQMDTTLVPTEMIGKRTRITVTPLGDVTNREILDTVSVTGIMRGVSQREAIRFHNYPGKAVKVGGKWNGTRSDTTSAMGGSIVTVSKMEYTLAGKESKGGKDALKVTYTGTMTVNGKGTMMGMQLYVEGSGKVSGFFFADPTTGLPLYDESTSDMESTAAITGQQNMTIPSSQTVVSRRTMIND